MDAVDRALINRLQDGFPISPNPYQDVAQQLGIDENQLLDRLQRLLDAKILSRFGPLYHAERLGGGLTLAALKVPPQRFESVTETVNSFPEVAHNYAREHELNMWFVLATETPQRIAEVITAIETRTGLRVYDMPKQTEYFVGLRLEV